MASVSAYHGARGGERGAALFIVVLIVVLLTAIGVFAVHVTSLAQVASGYSRRAASAFYLGEFAMNGLASDIANDPLRYKNGATRDINDCRWNNGLASTCVAIDDSALKTMLPAGVASDPEGAVYGKLSRDDSVEASVRIELTDFGPAPESVEGSGMTGAVQVKSLQTALTATGSLRPVIAGSTTRCNIDATRASENLNLRSYVVFQLPPGEL